MAGDLKIRSNNFAHSVVKLALSLPKSELANHIRKQLIRCATSTAANYRAASLGQTKKSFISKLSIVIEECDECIFWIEFATEEKLIGGDELSTVRKEARELTAIFIASRKTAMRNIKMEN